MICRLHELQVLDMNIQDTYCHSYHERVSKTASSDILWEENLVIWVFISFEPIFGISLNCNKVNHSWEKYVYKEISRVLNRSI